MPGEAGPKQRDDLPPRLFVLRVVQTLLKTLDWRLFSVLSATFLAYTWMLPAPERATKPLELLNKLAEIVGGNLVPWVGWIIAIGLTVVGIPYVVYAQRRINSLGEFQRAARNVAEPDRLSSRDKNIHLSYTQREVRVRDQESQPGITNASTSSPLEVDEDEQDQSEQEGRKK